MHGAFNFVQPGAWASAAKGASLIRAVIDEFQRAAAAIERFDALRRQGVARPSASRRIFDEFYSVGGAVGRERITNPTVPAVTHRWANLRTLVTELLEARI